MTKYNQEALVPGDFTYVHPRKTRDHLGRHTTHVYPLSERQVASLLTYIDTRIKMLVEPTLYTREQLERHEREVIGILTGEGL